MMAGIDWTWETFPEYLATVERLPKAINYGMYIGHSALRMYAMGRRGVEEQANEDDLRRMAHAVEEVVRAGAMGLSTSRATTHITPDGSPVASRIADWEEIDRLVGAMAALDAGVFQIGPDISGGEARRVFLERLRRVALESGRPIMFGVLATREGVDPNPWHYQTHYIDETMAAGGRMYGQATTRSINAVFSLKSYLPFDTLPGWRTIRAFPLEEQKRRLADPEPKPRAKKAQIEIAIAACIAENGGRKLGRRRLMPLVLAKLSGYHVRQLTVLEMMPKAPPGRPPEKLV
jgi:N-acyl-D-aspartate/D-glutamate deacylase